MFLGCLGGGTEADGFGGPPAKGAACHLDQISAKKQKIVQNGDDGNQLINSGREPDDIYEEIGGVQPGQPLDFDGKDEKARLAMANASLMAGVAFSNSMVGIVHAIGHACGGVSKVPHAEAMTILLPYCMNLNLELCQEEYSRILLAFSGPEVYSQTSKEERGSWLMTVP